MFGLSMVKDGILSTERRSKLHAVIDCLFFWLRLFSWLSKVKHFQIDYTAFFLQVGVEGDPGPKGVKVCFHAQYITLFTGISAKRLKRYLLKWRSDHRSCDCDLSNRKVTGCATAAVLYQLSYEDIYVGSRPIYWVHRTRERNDIWLLCELRTYEWNEEVIIAVVTAI